MSALTTFHCISQKATCLMFYGVLNTLQCWMWNTLNYIVANRHYIKKISFALRISSANVTKSAVSCGFGHIDWGSCIWKTSFFVQCGTHLSEGFKHEKIKCNLINCHCDVTLRFIYRQYVSYALFRFRSKFYTSIVFSWRVIINFALWLLEIAKSKNKQKQKRLDFDCLETVDVINNLSFN